MADISEFLSNPDPKRYLENDYICVDFETTNRDKGTALRRDNRLVLATWVGGHTYPLVANGPVGLSTRAHFGDEFNQEELADAINNAGFIVAHNAKFELQWLQRCGIEIGTKLVWDTMLGDFVIAGNRRWRLDLSSCAERYGLPAKESLVARLIQGGVCPSEIPRDWLQEYGVGDTDLCHRLFLKQREAIVEAGLLPVMFTRCLLTPVLADMELRGVQLDAGEVEQEYDRERAIHDTALRDLSKFDGGINWNSSKQSAELIYGHLGFSERKKFGHPDRTLSDRPRTDAGTIESLRATSTRQKRFIAAYKSYKKSEKRLQNLEKLLKCCQEDEGRLHAQYNQAVAGTHRLTSSGLKHKVQFQNIDNTIKQLFRAREDDWLVAEADGVQLEFRVAAHLGRDPVAIADIRTPGFDAHWQSAEVRFKKPRKDLTKEDRRQAKPYTFRPLYGATSGTKEEKAYIEFFQKRYANIYKTQTGWTYDVLKNGKLRTETGLIFYWPDTRVEDSADGRGYIRNRTSIFNYPVQSLATADIIPIAVVYMWHRIKEAGARMFLVNTVHDSIIAEVPPDEADLFRDLANRCFTVDCCSFLDMVYGIDFSSPLGCETKVGPRWGKGEERKYEYDPLKEAA